MNNILESTTNNERVINSFAKPNEITRRQRFENRNDDDFNSDFLFKNRMQKEDINEFQELAHRCQIWIEVNHKKLCYSIIFLCLTKRTIREFKTALFDEHMMNFL